VFLSGKIKANVILGRRNSGFGKFVDRMKWRGENLGLPWSWVAVRGDRQSAFWSSGKTAGKK
jgi:hypothetical protein